MKVLFDTHVLLWSLDDPDRIGPQAQAALRTDITGVVISVVSFWEIAIKRRRGQLTAPDNLPDLVAKMGHEVLGVSAEHAWHVGALPLYHSDPFDRLLVAQAQLEGLPLVTHDRDLFDYDVRIIRA